jgi:hypothetical protein
MTKTYMASNPKELKEYTQNKQSILTELHTLALNLGFTLPLDLIKIDLL